MSCLKAVITRVQNAIQASAAREYEDLSALAEREYADISVSLIRKQTSINVNISRTCDVFLGFPLYVADGRLYASDAALYVDKY